MAHRVNSPSLGSSSAHQGVRTSAPSSANQTPLDLNLSQKASQNPFKGHDETEISHHHKALTASQKAADALTSNANGCIVSNPKNPSEQTSQQEHAHAHGPLPHQNLDADSVSAASTAPNEQSTTVVEDGLPLINELAPMSAGQKRKSSRVEAAANAQKELLQSGTTGFEDGSPLGNGPTPTSPGLKRKSPRVKQTTSDTTKKVILALEANEDEGFAKPKSRPRGSGDMSKDVLDDRRSRSKSLVAKSDTPDLAERRMLLEERKVRLAEQRFALEEKKLEATIEIGKGLIISMERMTNTISHLGNSSSRHR